MKPESNTTPVETMLKNLPPDISPRLDQRLSSAPWTPKGIRRRQALTILYVWVLLMVAFIGFTPQGRAFAQSLFKFFTTTDQSSIPLSTEEIDFFYEPVPTYALTLVQVTPETPSPYSCSIPDGAGTYRCEIERIEKESGLDLKEFSGTPAGWAFTRAEFFSYPSSSNKDIVLDIVYQTSGGYLFLSQGNGDFSPDEVLSSAVEQVQIGDTYGEYVDGFFGVRNGDTNYTWDSGGADQRIRWREGERWFQILELAGPGTSGYMDKQTLIALAAAMVYQPTNTGRDTMVDLDFIPTIVLAEKICACDILEPEKLPANMLFGHARYDPERKIITLSYGYRALRIVQAPLESAIIKDLDSYKNVEEVKVGEVTGQFGISPAQKTIWESATPPAFPINNSYAVLLWENEGLIHQIYFDQSFSNGGQLTKEQMIEIAESLR